MAEPLFSFPSNGPAPIAPRLTARVVGREGDLAAVKKLLLRGTETSGKVRLSKELCQAARRSILDEDGDPLSIDGYVRYCEKKKITMRRKREIIKMENGHEIRLFIVQRYAKGLNKSVEELMLSPYPFQPIITA